MVRYGSLPFFRTGMNPRPSLYATRAPNRKPRASIPTILFVTLIFASDRWWVWLALYGFSLASAYSAYSLVTGKFMAPRLTFGLISAGFVSQTLFLVDRGHQIGRCPITNFFELLVFLGWSMTLIYLLIGSSYRLSLLGVITAPFVAVLDIWALLGPDHPLRTGHQPVNPWLETHTSFSIVACGAGDRDQATPKC